MWFLSRTALARVYTAKPLTLGRSANQAVQNCATLIQASAFSSFCHPDLRFRNEERDELIIAPEVKEGISSQPRDWTAKGRPCRIESGKLHLPGGDPTRWRRCRATLSRRRSACASPAAVSCSIDSFPKLTRIPPTLPTLIGALGLQPALSERRSSSTSSAPRHVRTWMHRIKHEAHRELYGHLATPSGPGSRTASPRRRDESPLPRGSQAKSEDAAESRQGLELIPIVAPDAQLRRQSPRPSIPEVHPQTTIDVPPDIAESITPSRLSALKVILIRILFFSWINVLLVMVPVAVAIHFTDVGDIAMFVTSTVAIVPLAALLGYSTEELAKQFGPATGALLNVTFGNATELIVFIIGIVKGELNVVQAAIIGSVLGNLLLVLGMAFFLGGLRFKEQKYNHTVTQTTGCLLLLAITSLTIPTAFHASFQNSAQADRQVLYLSYATSIVLLVIYGIYLLFQLKTHAYMYKVVAEDVEAVPSIVPVPTTDTQSGALHEQVLGDATSMRTTASTRSSTAVTDTEPDPEAPEIPLIASILLLIIATALVAVMAEFMVSSIQAVVATTSISEQFVGLIILPIVGNAAEHITAVTVAWKNKMDLSLGIALGSSLQIVLLVAPLAVLIGWIIGQPLTLYFSLFETLSVFATVLIVTYLVIDGRSNYLEGALLMAAYVLIAIASIFYPSVNEEA